jgi:prepilin-type N-terminal cleavage/methylation domain-containing protein
MLTPASRPGAGAVARARRGFTLAETMLVVVLGAIVLGLVATIGNNLQRQLTGQATRLSIGEQLGAGAELLPLDLRSLSPTAGDIVEASDTALQLRATVGSAVVCSVSGGTITVAPFLGAYQQSVLPSLQAGDSLWLLADEDSVEAWLGARIQGWRRGATGCSALDTTGAGTFDLNHLWSADLSDASAVGQGAVVRFTRPLRFTFYRAGDGQWYLGLRSWNTAAAQFNLVQPLSGPYVPPGAGAATRFEYFDSTGAAWSLGAAGGTTIARIEALLVAPAPNSGGVTDSQRVVVALRNR